jgi:hypothetical protein
MVTGTDARNRDIPILAVVRLRWTDGFALRGSLRAGAKQLSDNAIAHHHPLRSESESESESVKRRPRSAQHFQPTIRADSGTVPEHFRLAGRRCHCQPPGSGARAGAPLPGQSLHLAENAREQDRIRPVPPRTGRAPGRPDGDSDLPINCHSRQNRCSRD